MQQFLFLSDTTTPIVPLTLGYFWVAAVGIDPVDLEPILTLQVRMLRGEAIATPLRVSQAIDTRDAIAKFIYEHLFTWLVRRLNERLSPRVENADNTSNSQSSLPSVSDPTVIAVLDIFGFEDFHRNGFEQLCINTANEQLQYFFNQHIFTWELQEYQSEGACAKHLRSRHHGSFYLPCAIYATQGCVVEVAVVVAGTVVIVTSALCGGTRCHCGGRILKDTY